MNKQKPLALLMATIAIFMLAIACGSSETTTTTPNQGVTTLPATEQPSPPATDPATRPTTPKQANSQTAVSTQEPTTSTPGTKPWPTPLPTRTTPPTPRNPDQQTATAAAPQPTQPAQEQETTEPPSPASDVLPDYDGTSPLIHVYVEEPFILFEEELGATITLPIKGLTQDGQRVSVSNPTKWGITFTPQNIHTSSFDEKGTFTILRTSHMGGGTTLQFNLRGTPSYSPALHLPKEKIKTPSPTADYPCSVDYGSFLQMHLQWFLIYLPTREDQPKLEQIVRETGAISHGAYHYHDGDSVKVNKGYSYEDQSYILVEFSPGKCPTLQETLNAIKTWKETPGVQGTITLNPRARIIWDRG